MSGNHITNVHLTINIGLLPGSTSGEQSDTITNICSLLGQQMQGICDEKRRRSSRRSSRRMSSDPDRILYPPEVDVHPPTDRSEQYVQRAAKPETESSTRYGSINEQIPNYLPKGKPKIYEYYDLSSFNKTATPPTRSDSDSPVDLARRKSRRFRVASSKTLMEIPETALPKKKFDDTKGRRDYVLLSDPEADPEESPKAESVATTAHMSPVSVEKSDKVEKAK